MSLTDDDINAIAHLARLQIDPADLPRYSKDLSNILDLVEQMNAADTDGVEPMAHPHDESQRLREDAATETNQREKFQQIAPDVENGLFRVPRVIE